MFVNYYYLILLILITLLLINNNNVLPFFVYIPKWATLQYTES